LGLGLAIAKAVVEMHGGTISAASAGRGKGATFRVELKVSPEVKPAGETSGPGRKSGGNLMGASVLLVEDHPDTSRTLARLLHVSGHQVKVAHSVAAALELAGTETFDVVISDIGLPDASGYDLMRQIRDRYGIKGIALSGYGMEEDVRKSYEAGFEEHIVKPVDVSHLQATLKKVCVGSS
jgi:two-component system CheB/CheR fusion protein